MSSRTNTLRADVATYAVVSSLALLLSASSAWATPCKSGGAAKLPDACAKAPNDAALLACRTGEKRSAEAALRRVVEQLSADYLSDEPAMAKLFAEAQSRWEAFRDAECKVQTHDSAGGTAFEIYLYDCLTQMTRDRIKTLRARAESP